MAAANMLNGVAIRILTAARATVCVFNAAILFSTICAAPIAGSDSTGVARHTVRLRRAWLIDEIDDEAEANQDY